VHDEGVHSAEEKEEDRGAEVDKAAVAFVRDQHRARTHDKQEDQYQHRDERQAHLHYGCGVDHEGKSAAQRFLSFIYLVKVGRCRHSGDDRQHRRGNPELSPQRVVLDWLMRLLTRGVVLERVRHRLVIRVRRVLRDGAARGVGGAISRHCWLKCEETKESESNKQQQKNVS
jgi:hypothetical protein